MKILIIGGTKFVGRHLINAALEKGHAVTIFHRGKHSPASLPKVDQILGDRNTDLKKLRGHKWDAVIDTCGYLPVHVKASAEALKDSTDSYVFISSISAYSDFSKANFDEDASLALLTSDQKAILEEIDPLQDLNAYALGEMYGALKVLCEEAAARCFPDNCLIIRPGLIVGEFDWTDRFTYWVTRIADGGEVLAPGNPDSYVQFIEARDLAEWTIGMIEKGETGIYNATGEPFGLTFGQMLGEIKAVTKSNAAFRWVDDDFMVEHEVAPWSDMPVYLPDTSETKGFSAANIDRARAKGLKFRALRETIAKTFEWRKSVRSEIRAGLSSDREKQLLQKLREQEALLDRKTTK